MTQDHSAQAIENSNNFPLEELEKYQDKWVAWTPDGTRIIAGADDINELEPVVKAAGMKMSDVVFEYIPPLDKAFLGVFPLLGHAGFFQFFTAEFHGDTHEIVLTPNSTFPGTLA